MIKVEFNDPPCGPPKPIKFPWLGKHKYSELVVLFSDPEHGTIINPDLKSKTGQSGNWNFPAFEEFKGIIALSNVIE